MRISCPLYQDDWIHVVAHPDYPQGIFWCPECDAIWFSKENLLKPEQMFGVTYTRWQSFETLINHDNFWRSSTDLGEYSDNAGDR